MTAEENNKALHNLGQIIHTIFSSNDTTNMNMQSSQQQSLLVGALTTTIDDDDGGGGKQKQEEVLLSLDGSWKDELRLQQQGGSNYKTEEEGVGVGVSHDNNNEKEVQIMDLIGICQTTTLIVTPWQLLSLFLRTLFLSKKVWQLERTTTIWVRMMMIKTSSSI